MNFLAAAAPDPAIAWNTILAWAVIVPLVVSLITLIRIGKPQKREVTFGDSFVTKESCGIEHRHAIERITVCESDIREIRRELQTQFSSLNDSAVERGREMQNEISALRKDFNESLRRVHARIDDIPTQVIVTLKNTGALE